MNTPAILSDWLGVRPAYGRVAAALFEAADMGASREELCSQAAVIPSTLEHAIAALREAMDQGAITGQGAEWYRLTAVGMQDCRRALQDARRRAA